MTRPKIYSRMNSEHPIVIIGAGPAGLTAGYELTKSGCKVVIVEAQGEVGGLARSIDLWGHRVDLGPHRFFSSDPTINALWREVLEDDYTLVSRKTRILFQGQLFEYPLQLLDVLLKFNPLMGFRAIVSYLLSAIPKPAGSDDLEAWLKGSFGNYLYQIFFRPYSEKLWGLPCHQIEADFARQRIRKLNLGSTLRALFSNKSQKKHRTLVDVFAYPTGGAGMLYERMASKIQHMGGTILRNTRITSLSLDKQHITSIETACGEKISASKVISTMPISSLIHRLQNTPKELIQSVDKLKFRSTFLVYLLVQGKDLFPDQWIYVQDASFRVGRITNFSNWGQKSPEDGSTVLCLEIWSSPGDQISNATDQNLVQIAVENLHQLNWFGVLSVKDSYVHRIPKCYPVYYCGYRKDLLPIQTYLDTVKNLSVIGRYGSYKYNNQDHSILMGMMAADNITRNARHNLWNLNSDFDRYQEDESLSVSLSGKIVHQGR